MSAIETLLSRLHGVRQVKAQSWMSRCPAHNGDGRSLAVSVKEQGTILIHCFAHNCEAGDILAAVGMTVGDLFPDPIPEHRRTQSPRTHGLPAADVVTVLRHELAVVEVLMSDLYAGTLDFAALDRAAVCAGRIRKALDLCSG